MSSPGVYPAAPIASSRSFTASSFDGRSGAKPPSSPTAVDRPRSCSSFFERVVRLRAHAQRLAEAGRADRREHELLEVDVAVGVRAAVEHVEARHREHVRVRAADVPVEREVRLVGAGLGHRERRAERGVGPEAALGVGAVELDQGAVDVALVERLHAEERVGDLLLDVADGRLHALAAEAVAAVAQLDRLVGAGAGAARDRGPTPGAREQLHLDLDRGVPTGVEDLPGVDVDDAAHGSPRPDADALQRVVHVLGVTRVVPCGARIGLSTPRGARTRTESTRRSGRPGEQFAAAFEHRACRA